MVVALAVVMLEVVSVPVVALEVVKLVDVPVVLVAVEVVTLVDVPVELVAVVVSVVLVKTPTQIYCQFGNVSLKVVLSPWNRR